MAIVDLTFVAVRRPLRPAVAVAIVICFAVLGAACGDDDGPRTADSDPAAAIEQYRDAYNRGDIDEVMALFTDDSVVEGHPFDPDQRDLDEIRRVQIEDMAAAAPDNAYEISNLEVAGRSVSWDQVWRSRTGDEFCVEGNVAIVEGGKILPWTWPGTGVDCAR